MNSAVTHAAINSSKFIDTRCCNWCGICQRQAKPSEEKPPMPVSDASEMQNVEGREKETWSMRIPL